MTKILVDEPGFMVIQISKRKPGTKFFDAREMKAGHALIRVGNFIFTNCNCFDGSKHNAKA